MPCNSGPADLYSYDTEYRQRADELARILCELMQWAENEKTLHLVPDDAAAWWRKHKQEDRARVEREMEAIKRREDKEAALAKLSTYERSLLGYR